MKGQKPKWTSFLKWERWDEDELQEIVKILYEYKGYFVKKTHGQLEIADLIATKYIKTVDGEKPVETIGIQVTVGNADKDRAREAISAFNNRDFDISHFLVIALKGSTEFFDSTIRKSDVSDKVGLVDAEDLEKDLILNDIIPELEYVSLEKEFYNNEMFKIIKEITRKLYDCTKIEIESKNKLLEKIKVTTKLRNQLLLAMRGSESIFTLSANVVYELYQSKFDDFTQIFKKSMDEISQPLIKLNSALEELGDLSLRLIFEEFHGTDKSILTMDCRDLEHRTRAYLRTNTPCVAEMMASFDERAIRQKKADLINNFQGIARVFGYLKDSIERAINRLED